MIDALNTEWLHFMTSHMGGIRMKEVKPTKMTDEERGGGSLEVQEGCNLTLTGTPDLHSGTNGVCVPTTVVDEIASTTESFELTISTKTKVLFLNQPIDIQNVFWQIPTVEYWRPVEGVVKKQMKVVCKTPEEFEEYQRRCLNLPYHHELILKQINQTHSRGSKFKDERKITVGISKKDMVSHRCKTKNAFYNCFALILRFRETGPQGKFREIHVKVFNTGKMEIPGVVHHHILNQVKTSILAILSPLVTTDIDLSYIENSLKDHVLINSNFNCGYFIHRERLHALLGSTKYGIETSYDPCSYPGVKCKFYYNNEVDYDVNQQQGQVLPEDRPMKLSQLIASKKYTEISFMIFRTGSGLIVGNCSEKILRHVFQFIRTILLAEKEHISVTGDIPLVKTKKVKPRKRMIQM